MKTTIRSKISLLLLLCSAPLWAQDKLSAIFNTGIDYYAENLGGKLEFKRFIRFHLVYPEEALKAKEQGNVAIQCVISEKGEALYPKIVKHVSASVDAEAMHLFKLLKWTPAIASVTKKIIATELVVAFPFEISKYKKYCKERGFEKPDIIDKPADSSFVVYEKIDKLPAYFYGNDSLVKYINTSLEYPSAAKIQNIEGTVVLNCIVETDGKLSNIRVEKPVGGGCSEEAIEVLAKTRWVPAISNGKYVRYELHYPIAFTLQGAFHDNTIKGQGGQ